MSETSAADRGGLRSWLTHPASVALAGGVLLLPWLGRVPLLDQDEPRYADTSRHVLETGDWTYPWFNGRPRHTKPILIHWVQAPALAALGVSEFSVRLPSVLASVGTGLVLFGFAVRHRGRTVALAGLVTWLVLPQTHLWAKMCITDAVLTCLLAAALWAAYEGLEASRGAWVWYALSGLMMGCAALTKGPMGIIVPGAVYVVYALLSGSARRGLARPEPYLALTLALLVCLPWYAAQIHHYGQEYVDEFFGRQNVRRYTQAQDGLGPLGWLWPIPTVLLFAFPASVLLPSALRGALTALRAARDGSAAPRWRLFLALWALANVVLFAPCATRLPHYLMGVYPPAALLLADMLVREAFEAPPAARRSRWVAGALIGAGLLLAGGFAYGALHAAVLAPMANLHNVPLIAAVAWLLAACFAVAGCACAAAWVRLRGLRLVAAQWGMLLLVALAIADVTWPAVGITREQGLKELALGSRATLPPGARLITYGFDSSVVVYYSRHEQRRAPNTQPAEALRLLAERPGSRLITTEAWWPRLPRGKLVVVGGAPPYILAVLRE